MPKPNRAENKAQVALEAYNGEPTSGMDSTDYECLIIDMITDTIHHAQDLGYNGPQLIKMALHLWKAVD